MLKQKKVILACLFCTCAFVTSAQQNAVIGSRITDFPIATILNNGSAYTSFRNTHDKLLILDFFGTWCGPCLKVLPKLTTLQQKYKAEVNIILVSEESKSALEQFIQKRSTFSLPIIIDEKKDFIKRFQPPSYPFTVVINKNGVIIAVPSQEEVNEQNISEWLKMPDQVMKTENSGNGRISTAVDSPTHFAGSKNALIQLSQQFVYAAKTGDSVAGFERQLKFLTLDSLLSGLETDDDKKAFWINIYNGYTQATLKKNPDQYKKRNQFFSKKQIEIASRKFSLDEIEHAILRRSKVKWGLGLLNKWFPGKVEKRLRVDKLDYRIHFALNCGAKSCPPIAFYKSENLNSELTIATKAYLKSEVEYDQTANVVKLPRLMSWFRYDFGGKRKMIQLLQDLSLVPPGKNPKIKFNKYDWDLFLENYK
ncbi:MAG: DUF547 domain-containing protein [Chitinophagaceae bacterium]|nr:DUF547 domain-containing protein [Chitinophagaceae bacterium]